MSHLKDLKMNQVKKDQLWKHHNGIVYQVDDLVNIYTNRPKQYPVMVVYKNIGTGVKWCRPFSDWYRSFTLLKDV